MTIYKGNRQISRIFKGNTEINRVYKGSTLIFQRGSMIEPPAESTLENILLDVTIQPLGVAIDDLYRELSGIPQDVGEISGGSLVFTRHNTSLFRFRWQLSTRKFNVSETEWWVKLGKYNSS